jgi:Mce-associated membrane protein
MAVDADAAHRKLKEPSDPGLREAAPDGPGDDHAAFPEEVTELDDAQPETPRGSGMRMGLVIGSMVVVSLAGLVGWLGFRVHQSHPAEQQRQLFLEVGRQGALNLTTVSYAEADLDVQRILNSATGTFYDDFKKRSPAFIEIVKQAQSKSEGTITEAGLESDDSDHAQVLVAVTVKTSIAGATEQEPRRWRMRISVQKVGDSGKVSNVEFVP